MLFTVHKHAYLFICINSTTKFDFCTCMERVPVLWFYIISHIKHDHDSCPFHDSRNNTYLFNTYLFTHTSLIIKFDFLHTKFVYYHRTCTFSACPSRCANKSAIVHKIDHQIWLLYMHKYVFETWFYIFIIQIKNGSDLRPLTIVETTNIPSYYTCSIIQFYFRTCTNIYWQFVTLWFCIIVISIHVP